MDKYDEKAVSMKKFICECSDGVDCPRCSAVAAALREAADVERVAVYNEMVIFLSGFHANRCHPNDGECSCWTETQQKILQSKASALRRGAGKGE